MTLERIPVGEGIEGEATCINERLLFEACFERVMEELEIESIVVRQIIEKATAVLGQLLCVRE